MAAPGRDFFGEKLVSFVTAVIHEHLRPAPSAGVAQAILRDAMPSQAFTQQTLMGRSHALAALNSGQIW